MKFERRLTIEFSDGDVDEYRIRNSHVEFRPRERHSSEQQKRRSQWRSLDADDIALHLALRTPVGEWLVLRLQNRGPMRPSVAKLDLAA
jgi:hypothetical protein